VTQPGPTFLELADLVAQFGVDPVDLVRGLVGIGVEHIPDAGQRDTGLGEGDDPGQIDDRLCIVAPVPRGIPVRFGQQALGVIDADGLGRHAGMSGELPDRKHSPLSSLTLP